MPLNTPKSEYIALLNQLDALKLQLEAANKDRRELRQKNHDQAELIDELKEQVEKRGQLLLQARQEIRDYEDAEQFYDCEEAAELEVVVLEADDAEVIAADEAEKVRNRLG